MGARRIFFAGMGKLGVWDKSSHAGPRHRATAGVWRASQLSVEREVVVSSCDQPVSSGPRATRRRPTHTRFNPTRNFGKRERRRISAPRYLNDYIC